MQFSPLTALNADTDRHFISVNDAKVHCVINVVLKGTKTS